MTSLYSDRDFAIVANELRSTGGKMFPFLTRTMNYMISESCSAERLLRNIITLIVNHDKHILFEFQTILHNHGYSGCLHIG